MKMGVHIAVEMGGVGRAKNGRPHSVDMRGIIIRVLFASFFIPLV